MIITAISFPVLQKLNSTDCLAGKKIIPIFALAKTKINPPKQLIRTMSTIKRSGNSVSVEVSVFVYKDLNYPNGNMFIAYCPELDLVGYDITNRKARKSFEYVLKDYLDYTIQNGTFEEDLLKHGWRKLKDGKIITPTFNMKTLFPSM